jgi:hypothetical protein
METHMNRYWIVAVTLCMICAAWGQILAWSHAALTERQIILEHPWQSAAIVLLVILAVAIAWSAERK